MIGRNLRAAIGTVIVLAAIGSITISIVRGHPIASRDMADLWGCYAVDGRELFRLGPDGIGGGATRTPIAGRQGRFHPYLDPARPLWLAHREGGLALEVTDSPAGPIEVRRHAVPSLWVPSDRGGPIEAIRSPCR